MIPMNPTLVILLALIQQLKPADLAAVLAALMKFIDPVIATKGPLVRWAWSILKSVLPTTSFVSEIHAATQAHFAANPQDAQHLSGQAP